MTGTATDELESIVSMLREKYPDRGADEVTALVYDVYSLLSSEATVTAHLIPLTINRCHKVLKCRTIRSTKAFEPSVR
jgi:hypothetical protein